MSTKKLTRRQARWAEFLSQFHFEIKWRPGKDTTKPDALTRRSQDLPSNVSDPRIQHQSQIILKPHTLDPKIRKELALQVSNLSLCPVTLHEDSSPQDFEKNPDYRDSSEDDGDESLEPLNGIWNKPSDDEEAEEQTPTTPFSPPDTIIPSQDPDDEEFIWDEDKFEELYAKALTKDKEPREVLKKLRDGKNHHRTLRMQDCEERDGRLWYKKCLFIPQDDALQAYILKANHDCNVAGHPGKANNFLKLRKSYYWHGMHATSDKWVSRCDACRRAKPSNLMYQGLLNTLEAPQRRWEDIQMDFVTDLPTTREGGNTCLLVIVDRLTKIKHLIPCRKLPEARECALLFLQHVYRLHGLPRSIISDRGSQFVAILWKVLCKRLGIRIRLSTSFHPETDGGTERANAQVEIYIRAYCNYQQDDWDEWLPLCEFVINNTPSNATKLTPFFAAYGYDPRSGLEAPVQPNQDASRHEITETRKANSMADFMTNREKICYNEIRHASATYEYFKNKHRLGSPNYKVGDWVWLNLKNIKTTRPSKKFDCKFAGKFKILQVLDHDDYKLELPTSMHCHPVFHTNLLLPAYPPSDRMFPNQNDSQPPPVNIEENDGVYTLDEVVDSRFNKVTKRFDYKVKWEGYYLPTWEPLQFLHNAKSAVDEFHQKYPRKPKPAGYKPG